PWPVSSRWARQGRRVATQTSVRALVRGGGTPTKGRAVSSRPTRPGHRNARPPRIARMLDFTGPKLTCAGGFNALIVNHDARRLGKAGEMPAPLEPNEQQQARQGGQRADDEEQRPARALGDETRAGRQIGAPDGGERGE